LGLFRTCHYDALPPNDFDWKPDDYLERVRAAIPRYDELQEQAIAAVPVSPERVLELGMGTGETTRRLIEAYPDSWVIGLDSNADMVFRAREMYDDVQLARIQDPLPDGPWDLVIGVLSLHHLTSEQKKNLFRQVRAQARSFVIGDVVKADPQIAPIDPDYDFLERATDLAEWTGGEITWEQDDLAVIRAVY
jgi:tRNA (cmo5U34)-methyltransferase